jgi:hypothetical protein
MEQSTANASPGHKGHKSAKICVSLCVWNRKKAEVVFLVIPESRSQTHKRKLPSHLLRSQAPAVPISYQQVSSSLNNCLLPVSAGLCPLPALGLLPTLGPI